MITCNRWIVAEMLHTMPTEKKEVLRKALDRNFILTSAWVLSSCTLVIYKEGWQVILEGTRCRFAVYAEDNDGEFVFKRKPNEDKLHKLYQDWRLMDEDDYECIYDEAV